MAALLAGCAEERPHVSPPAPSSSAPVEDPTTVSSALWPTEVESLREAVEAFVSVEDCVASLRARTPTAVAESIADLAYEALFEDLCQGMAAVQSGSEEGCDALGISSARAGCRRRLALVHGRPEACPDDRVIPGREALCVAWSARDRGLCRAAEDEDHCRAVLERDARRCERLPGAERERCEAHVRRYGPSVGENVEESALASPAFTLELRAVGEDPVALERDVLARGVRLVPRGCGWALALANPRGEPSIGLAFGDEPSRFHLELVIPGDAEAPLALPLGPDAAVLSVVARGHGPLTSIAGAEGEVRIERFEPRRGGAIVGRLRGSLRRGSERVAVRGRFTTFVRDLEPPPARCAP